MPPIVEQQKTTYPNKKIEQSGGPGTAPRWSPSNKTAVGAAACMDSRVWFTLRAGSIDEVYYPDVDQPNTRSVRFLVTDGDRYFSDESGAVEHRVEYLTQGVPAYQVVCACPTGRYRLNKQICCDPARNAILMRVQLEDLAPTGKQLRLFLLVDPQISGEGRNNTVWIGSYKGAAMLCAANNGANLAAAAEVGFVQATCTYHGQRDAIEELRKHGQLVDRYNFAQGNAMLCGELDWKGRSEAFSVAVAFGQSDSEACLQARAGVTQSFDDALSRFTKQWLQQQDRFAAVRDRSGSELDLYRVSTMVLQAHQSKSFPGGSVASLSIPWGFAEGDKNSGGYHVAWPRDLAEVAVGKLAAGDYQSVRASLFYMACTQEEDGSWAQNMWLDGTRHWGAIQKDGIAMPVMLAARLREADQLGSFDPWPMIHRAVSFLLETGPSSEQDRWETSPGYNPFTLACEIGALHAASFFAQDRGLTAVANFLQESADAWNEAIESYLWVEDTELGRKHGVRGYYQRLAPPDIIKNKPAGTLFTVEPNHSFGLRSRLAQEIVCVDALALVRFGLRRPDDPRILSTLELIDKVLCVDLPTGRGWRRYNYDGYGEHADGRPYEKTGVGHCWPLLAGERAHYELAAGNHAMAEELCRTIGRQTSSCGMIPEQVWDEEDIPGRGLIRGRPSGSGMPLAWAHSEFVRLLRSLEKGDVWDRPQPLWERYARDGVRSDLQIWTEREPREWVTEGYRLRLDLPFSAVVFWKLDDGVEIQQNTNDSGLRVQTTTLDIRQAKAGSKLAVRIQPIGAGKAKQQTLVVRQRAARSI